MSSADYGMMAGRYPAVVRSYDQTRRTCRIEIPGLTDGANVLPEAEIEYPIGDKSRAGSYGTEIEILAGDTVWVSFIGGDSRYPIITGWRNPQAGNGADWRRWHHKNIEAEADETMNLKIGKAFNVTSGGTIQEEAAKTISVTAGTSITLKVGASTVTIDTSSITLQSAQINLNGQISGGGSGGATASFTGDLKVSKDVTAGSISLRNHTHSGVRAGGDSTGAPQ